MEDRRQKEQEKADDGVNVNVNEDEGIDTEDILVTEMKFGLDFVFRMCDPVLPGENVPDFSCKALVGDGINMVSKSDYKGIFFALIFYPKDFSTVGEDTLSMVADLVASKELNLTVLVVSTDSVETHRAWTE